MQSLGSTPIHARGTGLVNGIILDMTQIKFTVVILFISGLLLSGCGSTISEAIGDPTSIPDTTLIPYLTPTVLIQPTPQDQATAAPIPSPTPTPRIHILTNSDTLFALAYYYGVSVEEILSANPGLDRNILPAGKTIIIPPSKNSGQETTASAPTLAVLPFGAINCLRSQEGGLWCFLPVTNNQAYTLENISAQIRLTDQETGKEQNLIGTTPLNLLSAGQMLPVTVYFPPMQPQLFRADAMLVSELPVSADDQRYRSVNIAQLQVDIAPGGRTAIIRAETSVKNGESVQQLWVAAIAYDKEGKIIGVRRWKSPNGIKAGKTQLIEFSIYSVSGEIEKVECFAEGYR